MAINHADHDHPATPKARAACRARLATLSVPPVGVDAPTSRPVVHVSVDDVMDALVGLDHTTTTGFLGDPVAPATRVLHDCRECGFAHEATEAWCIAMGAELDRAAMTAERKGRKVTPGLVGGPGKPATGLMERHGEPITLARAEGRPVLPVPARLATERQIDFIRTLLSDRNVPAGAKIAAEVWLESATPRSMDEASKLITELKAYPFPARPVYVPVDLPDVPVGSYAIDGSADATNEIMFVEVWVGRTGEVRVSQQVSDSRVTMPRNATAGILDRIMDAGVEASMARYGHEMGECGACHRKLTNDESRARGIGPVCAAKRGW